MPIPETACFEPLENDPDFVSVFDAQRGLGTGQQHFVGGQSNIAGQRFDEIPAAAFFAENRRVH